MMTNRKWKKRTAMLSAMLFAVLIGYADDNLEEVHAAMLAANAAEAEGNVPKQAKSSRLLASTGGNSETTYTATGDYNNTVGSGSLNFTFRIDKAYTSITSAKLRIDAYDVDYPSANEHDKVYFNGKHIGRFKGVNNGYEINEFNNVKDLIVCPSKDGEIAVNKLRVDVNVDNGGWVTAVRKAELIINGETFKLTASRDDPRGIMLKWNDVGDRYNVYRRHTVNGEWVQICTDLTTCSYLDKNVRYGDDYHYVVGANSGTKSRLLGSSLNKSQDVPNTDDQTTPTAVGEKGGTPAAPRILNVELPKSGGWLRDWGPKCIRLTWNNWDRDVYEIQSIRFDVRKIGVHNGDKETYKKSYVLPYDGMTIASDDSDSINLTGEIRYVAGVRHVTSLWIPFHGKCSLEVWVTYTKKTDFLGFREKEERQFGGELKIFFHKYGDSTSEGKGRGHGANWYKYWPEDGALPEQWGKELWNGYQYQRYGKNADGNLDKTIHGAYNDINNIGRDIMVEGKRFGNIELPAIARYKIPKPEKFVYSPVVSRKEPIKASYLFETFEVGASASGINALLATMCHEDKHGSNREKLCYYNNGGRIGRIYVPKGDYFFEKTLNDAKQWISQVGQSAYPQEHDYFMKYLQEIDIALSEKTYWAVDHDGDGVLDHAEDDQSERVKGYETRVDSKDSLGLVTNNGSYYTTYREYADDEIRARYAEESAPGASYDNDWGVPGRNLALPDTKIPHTRHPITIRANYARGHLDWEGLTEEQWREPLKVKYKNEDTVDTVDYGVKLFDLIMNEYFYGFTSDEQIKAQGARKSILAKSSLQQSLSSVGCEGKYETVGLCDLYSYSVVPYDNHGIIIAASSLSLNETDANESHLIDALIYNVGIGCTNNISATVRAYLIDTNNQICVQSGKYVELLPGTNNVELIFGGEHIYRQRSCGYTVGLVEVVDESNHNYTLYAVATNVASTVTNITYSAFTPYTAVIVTKEPEGCLTESNLVFNCEVELNKEGSYTLVGELRDTNDVRVAHAICTNLTYTGLHTIQLAFSREDIYLSGRSGPYQLTLLELRDADWELVDWIEKPVLTDAFSLGAMRPNNAALTILSDSYALQPLAFSADGYCDAIRLSLGVSNALPSAIEFRASVTISNTNNDFVCRSYQTLEIASGESICSLEVPGVEIMKSGIDGPYYISDILLTPVSEDSSSERFTPVKELIDVPRTSFGGTPFIVAGETVCQTGNVYKPIIVEVPIDVMRAGDITASAIVTDTNGEFVVRSETNLTVAVGNGQTVSIEFNARDLMSSGIPGPYKVHYLVLRSGYEGVEEVRVEDFSAIVEYTPTLYVSAQTGNDEGDGLSDGTAFRTIQAALDFASDGAVIKVGAGDYICPAEIDGETFLNINKKVAIVASGSDPSETRIVGPRGSTTNDVRGVWLAEGATLSGLTITNFLMSAGGGVGIYGEGLGAVVSNCVIAECSATHDGGGVYQCTVYDSTIRNCRAQNGGGAAQSTLIRCLLDGNTATRYGGGIAYGTATNCAIRNGTATYGGGGSAYAIVVDSLIEGNNIISTSSWSQYGGGGLYQGCAIRCTIRRNTSSYYGGGMFQGAADNCLFSKNASSNYGGGTYATSLTNCTVNGNTATLRGGGVYNGVVVNSIIWGNTAAISNNHYLVRGVFNCTTPLLPGDGNIDADPCLRGADFGGFMLSVGSPCLDAGLGDGETAEYIYSGATNQLVATVSDKDFFGNERTQGAHVDMGAVEGVTNACLVMARTVGGGSVDVSFELVEPHSSLTITADESARPIDRFETHDGRIFTASQVQLDDITADTFLTAYFKYYDFYVDAINGNDANEGLSWSTAKRTLHAAIDCAVDGEKIWVAKGVYEPIVTNDKAIEIEAVEGALLTSIDGGGTNRCATLATSGSMASKTNSVLVGFTLTNGRSTQGAGAYGGTLKNCIIKSNTADGSTYCYGGGTFYGAQYDCRYENNSATATMYGYGGAAYYGTSSNCVYLSNSAYGPTNAYGGAVYYGTHYDCGLTNNTSSSYGGAAYGGAWYRASVSKNKANHGGGLYYGTVYESIIMGNRSTGDGGGVNRTTLTDCIVANNQAGGSGGGALLTDYSATRTVFKNNISRGSGGGVYGGTCTDCGITNNTATSNGGGAYNITATRTSFVGNSAANGGGVYNGTYNSCTVEGNTASGEGGGAYSGTFYDSLISGNTASGVGGGLSRSTFHRSRIVGNRSLSDGGGVYNGTGYNSLIVKNKGIGNGGGTYNGYNYNCTITENWCGGNGGGTSSGCQYSTIIVDNTNPDGEYNRDGGSVYNCLSSNAGDPMFVNPLEGDYRLRVGSPCINAGNNSYANGSTDLALETRIQDGTVDMGAYEGGIEGFVVSVNSVGAGNLEYDPSVVTNGGNFTISASSNGRTFLHFKTNGVVATTALTLMLDDITGDVNVTAEFVHEMFVDGTDGADDNDGLSWATAKKSIQAAIDASVDGDTIWVADGVYNPIVATDRKIDIVSVNGAGKAIIDGGGISCCALLGDETHYHFSGITRLSGFTLRNGRAVNGGGVKYGRIDGCVIENCHATNHGGGIDYSMTSNCVVRYNTSETCAGGAVGNRWIRFWDTKFIGNAAKTTGGGACMHGEGVFRNCEFERNIAGSNGGALYNGIAHDSTFSGNCAVTGGATYNGTFYRCTLTGNTSTSDGGGAYYGTFYDSVVSNNMASGAGGGLYRGTYWRSRVEGNVSYGDGGGIYNGTGYSSLIVHNKTIGGGSGGGTYNGYTYNCTIYGNYTGYYGGGECYGCHYNSIIWGNENGSGANNTSGGSYYSCKIGDPLFVDAGAGDFRLRDGSPCVNAGSSSYVQSSLDLARQARVQDGTIDIGAYEGGISGFVVSVDSLGSGNLAYGSCVVASGGTFSIAAQPTERAFLHFMTNGVVATTSPTLILTGISEDVKVTAVFVHELFVDGVNGADINNGLSWAAAKKTIQAAINVAMNGDTIWVTDGIYAPIVADNMNIAIMGVNGAEKTIIDGGNSARCAKLGATTTDEATLIKGFTLRNGYADFGGGVKSGRAENCIIENCRSTSNGGGADDTSLSNCVVRNNSSNYGGGSSIYSRYRKMIDCIFSGNSARNYGGGAYGGTAKNCSFIGNVANNRGGGLSDCFVYNSTILGNRSPSGGGTYEVVAYNSIVSGNTSTGEGGGAYSGTFYDSVISNNTASGVGGGLRGSTFHRSYVVGNAASGDGGGVYNGTGYNSIIAKNKTNGNGGGAYSGYNYNCTIAENYSALSGGGTYGGYRYNSIIWNNHNAYGQSNCEGGGSQYNCQTADPKFVNAAENDYRLRVGSPCLNAGNASYVNGSLDVARCTRVLDGTVDIGAHEGVVEGFVVNVVLQGGASASHSSAVIGNDGVFTVYEVIGDRPFVGILTNGVFASSSLPFTWTGITSDVELTVDCIHDLYVDVDSGDDGNSGFSRDSAKQSIQAAVDVSLAGDVIHVADGCYAPFSSGNRDIHIISDNGPDNCIVDGEYSARCATLGSSPSEVQTTLEGLTLCNGYSSAGGGCYYGTAVDCIIEDCYSTGDGGGAYGTLLHDCDLVGNVANANGGGVCGGLVRAWRCTFADNVSYGSGGGVYSGSHYDCTFEGNRASSNGGAAYGAILQRCTLRDNQASIGGGTYNGTMYSCLYHDNYASSYAGAAYYGTLYNCTLTRNKAAGTTGGMYYSTAYNTISRGNRLNSGAGHDYYGGSYYNCCLTGSSGSNSVFADPLFFDAANDDFRLSMNSPCVNKGDNSRVSESTDIRGQARIQEGTVDIGCYEGPVYVWQIEVVVCGKGRVVSSGTSVLDGGELTFTAVEDGSPFLGFYTNGVFATSEKDFTWNSITANGTLEAWFKQDIYVDANMPDDSGDGLSWETARTNLSAVVAETSNGANIWVRSGTYAPIVSLNKHLVITAIDGNQNTIISGGGTRRCADLSGGVGLISTQTNTVLIGFTLKDGFTASGAGARGGTLRNCIFESNFASSLGGGTYYGVQYDCVYRGNIVSNDAAYARGGAAYYGTSYNCTYTNNWAKGATNTYGGAICYGVHYDCLVSCNGVKGRSIGFGGGVFGGTYHRCIVTGNDGYVGGGCCQATVRDSLIFKNSAVLGGGMYSGSAYGCTIVDNTANGSGGAIGGTIYNSIIWGNHVSAGAYTNWNSSVTMRYSCSEPLLEGVGNICADPLFVDATIGNYRLTAESPCLNAGTNSYVSTLHRDIDSHERIQDDVVDMGCYEGVFSVIAETQDTPAPVPHVWLDAYPDVLAGFGGDYEAMGNAQSPGASGGGKTWANGSPCYVWQDFVAGTSPTNDTVFSATIRMDGNTPVITWEPDTPELRATRVYRTLGKKTLLDANWTDITDKDQSEYHFFKVTVDLP